MTTEEKLNKSINRARRGNSRQYENRKTGRKDKTDKLKKSVALPSSAVNNHSLPVLTLDVSFKTKHVQDLVEAHYKKTVSSLYKCSTILLILKKGDKAIAALNEDIRLKLQDGLKHLKSEEERVKTLIEQNNITLFPTYTNPVNLQIKLTSPLAKLFIDLVLKLDDVCQKVDALWYAAVLDDSQRNNQAYNNARYIRRIAGNIQELEAKAMKAAQNEGKEEEVEKALAANEETGANDSGTELTSEEDKTKKNTRRRTTSAKNSVEATDEKVSEGQEEKTEAAE